MMEKFKRLLASPRMPLFAALIGLLLVLPTLRAGLFMDDLTLRSFFIPSFPYPRAARGDWDLFFFQGSERGYQQKSMDLGIWPWFMAPEFRLAFFRPLSSLWHAFEFRHYPEMPWLMHAGNIALYGAIAFFVAKLYRRFLEPAWAVGLAALLYVIDDAHSFVIVWISNRNALLAVAFGFGAFWLYVRSREENARSSGLFGPIVFALGLCSGEAVLGTLAYFVAYALFLDPKSRADRARSLVPYALVLGIWSVAYKLLGYGARGGGFYVDPVREPLTFASALVERLPLLLLAQIGVPPADLWSALPPSQLFLASAFATVILALFALVLFRVTGFDSRARFFLVGMLLSLVPVSATLPNDRLLLASGLGAFGLVALFFTRMGAIVASFPRFAARALAIFFVAVHLVLAPLLLPLRAHLLASGFRDYLARAERTLPEDDGLPSATLVALTAPDALVVSYTFADRIYHAKRLPERLRVLMVHTRGEAELRRPEATTLDITLSEGFLHDAISTVFRGPSVPFHAGEEIALSGMRAKVAEVMPDGRPRRMLFQFDEPLESARYRLVRWEKTGFIPFTPPPVGGRVKLSAIDYSEAVFGQAERGP